MFKKIKKTILLSLCFLAFLTGCQQQRVRQIQRYTESNVPAGLYVYREDGYYYSLYNFGGASPTEEVQWEAGENYLIPHLFPGDDLVLFTNDVVPQELSLYSYTDFGPTVGVRFSQYLDTEKFTISDTSNYTNYCPTSVQLPYFEENLPSLKNIRIEYIEDGTQMYDFDKKLISSKGLLKGLTADAIYNLYYYQGTQYGQVKVKADTHAYILDKSYVLKNYVELQGKHFSVRLPKNMESGYWMIEAGDSYGMFFLEPDVQLFGQELVEKSAEEERVEDAGPSQEEMLEDIDLEMEFEEEQAQDLSEVPVEENPSTETEAPAEETSSESTGG